MRLSSITIDADGSPCGYVAWYNHHSNISRIRNVRPVQKHDRYGIQRMEMIAIYFALSDNLLHVQNRSGQKRKRNHLIINIRSDSKSTVEQLQGISEIRDNLIQRIFLAISNLLRRVSYKIVFNHLDRTRNIAGLLLERRNRREKEKHFMNDYEVNGLDFFRTIPSTYCYLSKIWQDPCALGANAISKTKNIRALSSAAT